MRFSTKVLGRFFINMNLFLKKSFKIFAQLKKSLYICIIIINKL